MTPSRNLLTILGSYSAIVMLAVSGLSFTLWRIGRNLRLLYKDAERYSGGDDFIWRWRRPMLMHQKLGEKTYSFAERMLYYSGLRRIEKTGIGAV